MATISNDHELRDVINALTTEQQRTLGARFAQNVLHLCGDDRVRRAVEVALDAGAGRSALEDAFKAAKSYATKTYTACGRDTDWLAQADHFAAAAAAGALTPASQLSGKMNPAWKAAVQARMAKNCELMEEEEGEEEDESERQYRIANEVL